MCGIAGVVSWRGDATILDEPAVRAMSAAMRMRGPDGEGFYRDAYALLAHRRLSILDHEGGAQPMATPDGSAIIVFNGEIYNFAELRARLVGLGHAFRTRSDTEVILDGMARYASLHWDPRTLDVAVTETACTPR